MPIYSLNMIATYYSSAQDVLDGRVRTIRMPAEDVATSQSQEFKLGLLSSKSLEYT